MEDIDEFLDLVDKDTRETAQKIIASLKNDRQQAQKARLEARMATTQITQEIHELAVQRWKNFPVAVQREHDILAMDIAELEWHLRMEKSELRRAQNNLDYAKTINSRIKADIEFNQKHMPLVEEKLRIEESFIQDIKTYQVETDVNLQRAREKLEAAEIEFERKSKPLKDELKANKNKLEVAENDLEILRAEQKRKEAAHRDFSAKIEVLKTKIANQDDEIEQLKKEEEILQAKEKVEQGKIEECRVKIRKLDQETYNLDHEREAIEDAMEKRKQEADAQIQELTGNHDFLVSEIARLEQDRDVVKMHNEGIRMKIKTMEKQRGKMEKDLERIRKNAKDAEKEQKTMTSKTKTLTANINELSTQIERKEKMSIGAEDNLMTMIDQTRSALEEANRNKKETETNIRDDSEEFIRLTNILEQTKTDSQAYQKSLREDIAKKTEEYADIEEQRIHTVGLYEETAAEVIDKAAQFKEIIEGLTAELARIPVRYKEEEEICIDLDSRLEKLIKHEEELIQRVAELKAEQVDLKNKREKVLTNIESLKEDFKVVESHFALHKQSLEEMEVRLTEAKSHKERRELEFSKMLEHRNGTKEHLTVLLRDLVMSNAELAQSYKVIQAKEMAVKHSASAFFELRNILDDSKMWVTRLIAMENEFHDKTKRYHECRDAYHSCEYQVLEKNAKNHVARVLRIESQLNKGLKQVTSFIDKLFSKSDLSAIEQSKRQSLMEHTAPSFSRMSLVKTPVIPAIEKKASHDGDTS